MRFLPDLSVKSVAVTFTLWLLLSSGLAVLPARLKKEMSILAAAILEGKDVHGIADIEKHGDWVDQWKDNYNITPDNINSIIKDEIGKVFVQVLECAGVYKHTEEGLCAFKRFISQL